MRSMLFATIRDLFQPFNSNGVNEVINAYLDLVQYNLEKDWRQDRGLQL